MNEHQYSDLPEVYWEVLDESADYRDFPWMSFLLWIIETCTHSDLYPRVRKLL